MNDDVALVLSKRWRVMSYDGQWILQSQQGDHWRSHGTCRSRDALMRLARDFGLNPAKLASLPADHP